MSHSRKERIRVELKLDKTRADRHKSDIRTLTQFNAAKILEGDVLNVGYTFDVFYYGDVAYKLRTLIRLLDDPEMIVKADIEELLHGHSVIVDVARKLENIIQQIRDRGDVANSFSKQDQTDGQV